MLGKVCKYPLFRSANYLRDLLFSSFWHPISFAIYSRVIDSHLLDLKATTWLWEIRLPLATSLI